MLTEPATTADRPHPRSALRGWLPESAVADLDDRCRRTEQTTTIKTSLNDYPGPLDADPCQDGAADDTDAGVSYRSCGDCQARELLAHLVPPLADLGTCPLHTQPVPRPATAVRSLIPVPRAPKE